MTEFQCQWGQAVCPGYQEGVSLPELLPDGIWAFIAVYRASYHAFPDHPEILQTIQYSFKKSFLFKLTRVYCNSCP